MQNTREIEFEGILNFRDLGGYQTRGNRHIAWRRLFRSGELHCMTEGDVTKLKQELKIKTIIDMRGAKIIEGLGVGLVKETEAQYYNVPMTIIIDPNMEKRPTPKFNNLHENYLARVKNDGYGKSFIEVLKIIADPANHPAIFHCNAGADRSGIMSAIILDILGVSDKDIRADYGLTVHHLPKFMERWNNDVRTAEVHRNLPEYQQELHPETITALLATLRVEYGSVMGYLESFGAEKALFTQLEKALLV